MCLCCRYRRCTAWMSLSCLEEAFPHAEGTLLGWVSQDRHPICRQSTIASMDDAQVPRRASPKRAMVSEGWVLSPKRPPTCGTKTRNGGFWVLIPVAMLLWEWSMRLGGRVYGPMVRAVGTWLSLSVDCAVPAEMGRRARPAERGPLTDRDTSPVHGYSDMRLLYQPRFPGPGVWDCTLWETIVPGIYGNSEIFWLSTNHHEWVSR